MSQDRLPKYWAVAMAGYVLVVAAALVAPFWPRLVVCLLCLGGTAWWVRAVLVLLRKKSAILHDLAAEVNADAERRARLEAAAGELIQKMAGRASLVAALSDCAACQRQVAKGVADLLEDVALIQEDFSQLAPGLSTVIETDGPAIRGQLAGLLALVQDGQAKANAATQALTGLQTSLEQVQIEIASRSHHQLSAMEKLLSEVQQGQAALAASTAIMAEWRHPIDEIGRAVQLATDLAEQARILGINASIEALRSGEAGRGFLLVAEEAERLSDRMLRVAHQMAAQIDESEKSAATAAKQLDEVQALLARLGEQGRRLIDRMPEEVALPLPVPQAGVAQLAGLVGQLAALADGLDGRLAGMLQHLEAGPAKEGQIVAKRLFGTLGGLAKELKTFAARLDKVCEAARQNESGLEAMKAVGRDLEAALAGRE